jgi:hypothetical protein
MSKTFKVAVSWEVCSEVEIEADSIEQALKEAKDSELPSPEKWDYVDGSWRVDSDMSKYLNNIKDE